MSKPALVTPVVTLLCFIGSAAFAGEAIQPGFYSHQPADVGIRISGERSGELCTDASGLDSICRVAIKIPVEGFETCIDTDGNSYPCTRYGYRYDYNGATPDTEIQCHATLNNGFNKREKDYSIAVESDAGSIFRPSWMPYSPVDKRVMIVEEHICSYSGARLATIEFILTYEPSESPATQVQDGPNPSIDEPYIDEVPHACDYLTRELASVWVRDEDVKKNSTPDMHVPYLQSLCKYSAIHGAGRQGQIFFKFHVFELFNIEKLEPMQLTFNATFAGGGKEPQDTLHDLGKISFVYDLEHDTTSLLVVTGLQGPADGAGRPTEFMARYYLQDPGRPHPDRLVLLIEKARRDLDFWHSQYGEN